MEKLNWLDKVKVDAEYITKKRIKEYQEEQLHTKSKQLAEVKEKPLKEVKEVEVKPKAEAKKGE